MKREEYICVYIYVCVCIYIYICIFVCIRVCLYVYIYINYRIICKCKGEISRGKERGKCGKGNGREEKGKNK